MLHTIHTRQLLKCSAATAWQFLSDPANLGRITPPRMDFQVLNPSGEKMYPGQIIEYKVRPLAGIAMHWVTEITHVKEGEYFVDEQRYGPYAFWHHQHFLQPAPEGVIMNDLVHYKVPLGALGKMINELVVKKKLEQIFSYRQKKLDSLFNDT